MLGLQYLFLFHIGWALEQGKYVVSVKKDQLARIPKNLYKGSEIRLSIHATCEGKDKAAGKFHVEWMIRSTNCIDEYVRMTSKTVSWYYANPDLRFGEYGDGVYQKFDDEITCDGDQFTDHSTDPWKKINKNMDDLKETIKSEAKGDEKSRKRRDTEDPSKPQDAAEGEAIVTAGDGSIVLSKTESSDWNGLNVNDVHKITTTPHDSQYLLIIGVKFLDEQSKAELKIIMKGPKGYLSAHEYPLLNFYMVMCIVYILYGIIWLLFSGMNYKELLRIQFWIGGVIFLGMLEKAVYYSEYSAVNHTGISVTGANKFAEAVSALKRSLARMLVIIVSLGFGIIKPRLGPMLHRIVGVGALYFILATVEAFVRVDSALHDMDNRALIFTQIPLAILDSVICWWIFVSLMSTMKTLRLRRNVIKLSLYRHFANIVIFMVVASVIFILWDIHTHRGSQCLQSWDELWLNEAFWHILFSIILFSIMILWRPSAMNQRYAYSPLVDGDSDDEEEGVTTTKTEITKNIKKRGDKGGYEKLDQEDKMEEDLKWIDENIPETVADAALPALMDSDEEGINTKYEMSKME